MGIFTWTDCTVKNPYYKSKHGWMEVKKSAIVDYCGYAKLLCPDGTEIETDDHDYYGCIEGYDIYELVAEWNKADLLQLTEWGKKFGQLVEMFVAGKDDDEISNRARELYGEDSYLVNEWKRNIGIDIACEDEDAKKLKYPIKLTKDKNAHGYENYYISYSCQ